ncbi:2-O-A-mannosyl-D-glycerate-specific PTS system IIC component [Peribacillus deserti]|uniref:2-O-A-mannosyl-D-glycerate-specific PTS system IIC component n=1 Tax=Peribacillus deserti TaxID=673318 RepID=A0ABS2QHX8_9BACI|nr:PTS 2-O-a-mannosyl-D-glycerate transporter subunit IIABC [Peribacillus deserti]MBM7692766.1 2-O-A-mannosyl-D-glycerate-specific PTS system IIC component [Peribacillus deserti]
MNLQAATSIDLIQINQQFTAKDEAIRALVKALADSGKLSDSDAFYQAVLDRERLSPTGFEKGLAIPHGKSAAVKEAAFAVATLQKPITDWESIDPANQVDLVFLLAIPNSEAGSTHLALLSELVTRLSDPAYKEELVQCRTAQELFNHLGESKAAEPVITLESHQERPLILAVTACPAGIAHTYMAAEALVKAGKELNVDVKVEKQGANGIEDKHTKSQLRKAAGVIFANDVAVKDEERYHHLPRIKTSVASPIKDSKSLIVQILNKKRTPRADAAILEHDDETEDQKSVKTEIKDAILTGISYIIPIIVAGGMISAFATLIAQGLDLEKVLAQEGSWLFQIKTLGGLLLSTLMVPILAAYMSYSIADKPGLAPGFAAGVAANMIGSGFLGGMLGGFLAGYLLKYMKAKIKSRGTFAGFISFWVYPVFGSLITILIMLFVIGKPVAWLNTSLIDWLGGLSGANALVLGALIGAFVSFDLGGPVNKAAYTFCIGAMASGNFIPYAVFASVKMVSAFSVTAATLISKRSFNKNEQAVGKQTWVLGLAGITEGAIPFMINDPLRVIPSLVIGSAVTGAMVAVTDIGLNVPGAGIFSLALLQGGDGALMNGVIWLGSALIGAAISTALLILTRKQKIKKLGYEKALQEKAA